MTMEFEHDDLMRAKKATINNLKNKVKIDGFRKNKTPDDVLISHVGEESFLQELKTTAIEIFYSDIITEEKLSPVSQPEVKSISEDPLVFELSFDVFPVVKIKDLKKIKAKKEEVKVTDKEVMESIEEIQSKLTKYKPIKTAAKKNYKVEIDFEGFDKDGKSIEGTKSLNHPLIIGLNTFIPGFEDNLIGLKEGENKSFKITFPKDYQKKELQNKEVKFEIQMKKVEEPIKATLDDSFAKDASNGQFKTLEELKTFVKDSISAEKDKNFQADFENKVLEQFHDLIDIDMPESLINYEVYEMYSDFQKQLETQNMNIDKYLEIRKIDHNALMEEFKDKSSKRLTLNLGIKEFIKQKNITLTDKEVKSLDKNKEKEESSNKELFSKALNKLYTLAENNA